MSQLETPIVEIDRIDVEEGFNPRKHMDPEALARLADSLKGTEMVQPVTVRPGEDGRFFLIAGHRRLKAAKLAGIEKVPIHVRKNGNARTAALVENFHREDLDAIDAARGMRELAAELNLTTNKKIAEELNLSEGWVSQHLRLLNLPEEVQTYIAEGVVPLEAERLLRKIAEVAPRVAECVCELAKRKKVKSRDFVRCFDELLAATAEARFENKPTMISTRSVRISQVITDPKKRRDLGDRHKALRPHGAAELPVRFSQSEVDAARAARCLIEHTTDQGTMHSTLAFITDPDLAADLTERAVEREEKKAARRRKEEEKWRAEQAGRDPGETPEQRKEARQAAYRQRQERVAAARIWNLELGRKLLQRRGGASRKKHALARFKALAAIILLDNPTLAARGPRLVVSQLQDIEVKQLKTAGETKEKVSYADPAQCSEYLWKRIQGVHTVDEGLELLGDAVVASLLADEEELPQSKRVNGGVRAQREVEKLLSSDIKSVRPQRRRRKA